VQDSLCDLEGDPHQVDMAWLSSLEARVLFLNRMVNAGAATRNSRGVSRRSALTFGDLLPEEVRSRRKRVDLPIEHGRRIQSVGQARSITLRARSGFFDTDCPAVVRQPRCWAQLRCADWALLTWACGGTAPVAPPRVAADHADFRRWNAARLVVRS
jgi:hypothetical protein